MENAQVTFDSKEWENLFKRIGAKLDKVYPILRTAFSVFGIKDIVQHFSDEQGDDGKWKPRSQYTNMIYDMISSGKKSAPPGISSSAFRSSNKILQLTRALRQSFIPANIQQKGKSTLLFFSNIEYSGKHDRGEEGMPKRSFMWLSENAMEYMSKYILDTVVED